MQCNIKVISPVHIGSGERYGASEYLPVTLKNKSGEKVKTFKRINVSDYYISLDARKQDEFITKLSNPEFSLREFDTKIPNAYRKYLALDKCSKKPKPNQEIEETIKTLNKSYIPGSSIKGAIKTAILYDLFDFDDCNQVDRFINKKRWDFNRDYNFFMDKFFTSKLRLPSAQKDVMKFLQVGDTSDAKQISVYDIYSVMAAEFGGRRTNIPYRRNKNSKEATISYYEAIDPGNKLELTINNNYNPDVHSNLKLGNKIDLINIKNIKKSIFNHSKDYIDNELKFSDEYGIELLNKFYKLASKLNTKETPLLKVGAGSGFLATTMAMKIQEYDPGLYDKIRKQKRGYDFCFPKSRKVTGIGQKPLGWIQLDLKVNK